MTVNPPIPMLAHVYVKYSVVLDGCIAVATLMCKHYSALIRLPISKESQQNSPYLGSCLKNLPEQPLQAGHSLP